MDLLPVAHATCRSRRDSRRWGLEYISPLTISHRPYVGTGYVVHDSGDKLRSFATADVEYPCHGLLALGGKNSAVWTVPFCPTDEDVSDVGCRLSDSL